MASRVDIGGTPRIVLALAAALCVLGLSALAGLLAAPAGAEMKITRFDTEVSSTQAGGHPDVRYTADWTTRVDTFEPCNCEDPRILDTHFPTGFIGNPHAVPTCPLVEFAQKRCSPDTQVGVLSIITAGETRHAIYNMQPHVGEPGLLGFTIPVFEVPTFVVLHGRTGSDYGLDATSVPVFHPVTLNKLDIRIWGVPAAHSHDANRFPPEISIATEQACKPYPEGCFTPVESNVAPVPYLQNPTTCGEPLWANFDVTFYTGFLAHAESPWGATTGCDQLRFDPSLTALPTTTAADSPSGLDIDLRVPQPQSPSAPSPSEIRAVKLTTPPGFSLISSAANGKTACSDAELLFTSEEEEECPELAKIGTASIDSSALPGAIQGNVYIGQPQPGHTYRLFVTADGFATHVKLKGIAQLDPDTGQVVTEFVNLPQSPIQEVELHLFGSERGIFGTPTKCGTYPVHAEFVPWDAVLPNQTSTSFFTVNSGPGGSACPGAQRPFEPTFRAGATDNTAGAFSPFSLQLNREDGDQFLSSFDVDQPRGWLAALKGTTYCPESTVAQVAGHAYSGLSELASPACPASSHIGSVTAGAAPGTRPIYVSGNAYLAGPYKGAPLSLLFVVPAVSGPYDLGNVVVRAAVRVDPATARVSAITDPLPQLIEGVPLRTRSLQIRLDRPDFALNPTNCDPTAVVAKVGGDEGAADELQSHFQVADCADLDFDPKLSFKLTGGLRHRGHPAIHTTLTAGPGEANLRRASVTLPRGFQLDNEHFETVCTRVQFAAGTCPTGSRIGVASLTTPLLDDPLSGYVYLRSSSHGLPDLAIDLKGQVPIEISARVDNVHERFRTIFDEVPDAPVSSFSLNLYGGSKGLLVNQENLCGTPRSANARFTGQNGVSANSRPKLELACGSSSRHRRHRHHRKGA